MTRSILLLDSNPDTAEMYAAGFRLAGFHAVVAADGEAAREHLSRGRPDALVVDARDAARDGWDLLRRLQIERRRHPIRLIVLTAWWDETLCVTVRSLGGATLVMTPCLPDALASLVRCVLPDEGRTWDGVPRTFEMVWAPPAGAHA